MLQVHAWAQTDVGRQRSHNEDNFISDLELGLFGVADGMGGHAAGEVASETALKGLREAVSERIAELRALVEDNPEKNRAKILKLVDASIQHAAKSVYQVSQEKASSRGMGTTLSVLLTLGTKGVIAHVGDSRVFLLRDKRIFQLTEDHSLVNEQLRLGLITEEEAERSPYKNVITRAVGAADVVQADILFVDLLEQDRFMICSDGLHGYFQEDEVAPFMAENDLEAIPGKLIDLANERGGKDNITAILVSIEEDEPKTTSIASPTLTQESEGGRRTEVTLRMDILQRIPLFQHMSFPELVKIMNITYLKTYQSSERVIEEGRTGDILYIILKGDVGIFRKGKRLYTLTEGQHFGEMAIIDKSPRSATAIVETEEAQLLTINRKNFIQLLRKEQGIAVKILWGFLKSMSGRLRENTEKLIEFIESSDNDLTGSY